MATYIGRDAAIKIGTSTVSEMMDWDIEVSANLIENPVFGTTWNKVQGLGVTSWKGSANGLIDLTDTTGQDVLRAATISGTKVTAIRFYVDGTTYYSPDTVADTAAGCYISNFKMSQKQGDVGKISFNFAGTGPLKET